MIVDQLDLAISYTETAATDAAFVVDVLSPPLSVYDYKRWLDKQEGKRISTLAERIYVDIPCVILVTRDWFVRPATIFECAKLRDNRSSKLVFDYVGQFRSSGLAQEMVGCEFGEFSEDGALSATSILAFARRTFANLEA